MEKAIKRAIDGGYSFNREWSSKWLYDKKEKMIHYWVIGQTLASSRWQEAILLDPLFFQALGKAEGWSLPNSAIRNNREWQNNMHRFLDHVIEGKPIDDFFNQLLK